MTGLHGLFLPLDTKIGTVRDAPTPEELSPFAPYRGPLVDSVTTEVVLPEDVPPPFYRVGPDDPNFSELRSLAEQILSDEVESVDPFETAQAAYEQSRSDDDPPSSAPNSAIWWYDKEDEEDDGLDVLRPTG
jgi:hypothetical protein